VLPFEPAHLASTESAEVIADDHHIVATAAEHLHDDWVVRHQFQ